MPKVRLVTVSCEDAKICYLRADKGTELTGGKIIEVVVKLGAKL